MQFIENAKILIIKGSETFDSRLISEADIVFMIKPNGEESIYKNRFCKNGKILYNQFKEYNKMKRVKVTTIEEYEE